MFEDDGICTKCGEVHTACSAHNREGRPCRRLAMKHLTVCNFHGGHSKAAIKARAKRDVADMATRALGADPEAVIAHEGILPVEDPLLVMGKAAASSAAMTTAMGRRLNYLAEDELHWTNREGVAQISELFKGYERSLDRTMRFSEALLKAGFAERQLQLDEFHARTFNTVMRAVLGRLDLTPHQREIVPGIVVEELGKLEQRQPSPVVRID